MFSNELILEQRQTLSIKQVQSLEILAYTNQELDNFLTNEYLENPMLENSLDKHNDMIRNLENMYERGVSYKEHYTKWEGDDCSRRNDIPARTQGDMLELLMDQLSQLDYRDDEWKIMKYLVQCLDEEGFFTYEVCDIAEILGVSEGTINKYLNILKNLEPVGIFSKDISECLKKQLEVQEANDEKLLMVVEKYMPDLLRGNISAVSRTLGLSTAKIKQYIHIIGSLNPRPIMNMPLDTVEYIVPDILVTLEKEQWNVIINDKWMGEYKYNEYYIRMMQESKDEQLRLYFKEKLNRARFIVNCIEQRRCTVIKIVEEILKFQEDFFKYGGELKPMCMKDIAEKIGMHLSTVSRAIKDKYIQYKKTILIKDLFTTAAPSQNDICVDVLKKRLKELIEHENSGEPLSDSKITDLMQKENFEISRRTVAKYRKQMGIPESRQRYYLG